MVLRYMRSWEGRVSRRVEIDITVRPRISPPDPPSPGRVSYFAVTRGGRRYRVTRGSSSVVSQYAGQTVRLTGVYSTVGILARAQSEQGNEEAIAGQRSGQDLKSSGCYYPAPSAQGIVRALRVRPMNPLGKGGEESRSNWRSSCRILSSSVSSSLHRADDSRRASI